MKNILFPINDTQHSLEIVKCLMSMYSESGMRFHILPIAVKKEGELPLEKSSKKFKNQWNYLRDSLNKDQKLITLNWKGDIITNIQEAVIDYDIELIVLGKQKAENAVQDVVTSFNKHIITRVKCPVFLLPENLHCHQPKQIVLLTDYRFAHRSRATSTLFDFIKDTGAHLSILQLSKRSHSLTQAQVLNKSFLSTTVESLSHSFHFVIDKTMDKALEFFINAHKVDTVVLFAKHINLSENLLFSPVKNDNKNYHRRIPFLIIHE